MADEKKSIEDQIAEKKAELAELQDSTEVTGTERLDKTKELVAEIAELKAEQEAAAAAEAALAEAEAPAEESEGEDSTAEGDAAETTGGDPEEAEADAEESGDAEAAADEATSDADAGEASEGSDDTEQAEAAGGDTEEQTVNENTEAEALAATASTDKPTGESTKPKTRITAAVTTDGFSAGQPLTWEDIRRGGQLAKSRQEGRQIIAAIDRGIPGDAVHGGRSADENARIMAQATKVDHPSLTAACFCDPADAVKEIQTCGVDARPVLNSFRTVPVTGRFKYTKDLGLADVDGAAVIWECADQDAVDIDNPATYKPCVELDCGTEIEVEPYAIPVCGTYDTFVELSHPQRVQAFMDKLSVLHARVAERKLLDEIRAASRIFTYTGGQGAYNSLVHVLGQLASPLQYGERLGSFEGYNAYVPVGTIEALTTDLLLSGTRSFDTAAKARAFVVDTLNSLGISSIIEILDVDTSNETDHYLPPVAALPAINTPTEWVAADNAVGTHKLYLLRPEDFRVGLSSIVEAGTIRDASLVKANKVQWFMEGLEFIEKTGCGESIVLEIEACTNGLGSGNGSEPDCAPAA